MSHLDLTRLVILFDLDFGWFLVIIKVCVTSLVLSEHKDLCD
jgi:hypothetical protein